MAAALWIAAPQWWWISVLGAAATLLPIRTLIARAHARANAAESDRTRLATQLDRRISELFSLQELSYVLSESIALDRIVEQVTRFAVRFLQADGAIVVLPDGPSGRTLRVADATGSLSHLLGCTSDSGEAALVRLAVDRGRIEVAQGVAVPTVLLFAGVTVRSAAVVPLRAHGDTVGALAVADRQGGPFTTEDLWLLSTVATQASVTIANSRLYEMVRQSTEEWETAFNALTEGIAVVSANDAVLRANESLARLAGIPQSELVGRPLIGALFGSSETAERLLSAVRAGERPPPLVARSDQVHRVFRLTAAPFAAGGAGASLVVLVEDVTEQRAMEAQLFQTEKMASIGQLVSGVAHELNNPLTSIRGLAELLMERSQATDPAKEHLRVIHDQAERAGRIVRNLLTFARKGGAEKAVVDLNDVVSRTALLISYELKLRGIELESRLSTEPVPALADRYELQQVLLNLVTNAAQAVSEAPPDRPRAITIETEAAGSQVVLRVRDTGAGVPEEAIPFLFTPFFTTKGPGHGTGLGLSLSYGLIESHGGRLAYHPSEGGGAVFAVTLPRVDLVARASGAYGPPPEGPSRRILIVDDDVSVQRLLSALFSPDGHVVDIARTGDLALRLLEETTYDLVVADARALSDSEPFAPMLVTRWPVYRGRVLVAVGGRAPTEEPPFGRPDLAWILKPFNLRDLRRVAEEIFETL